MIYVYNSSRDKHGKKYLKYLRFFLCNFPYSEYKGVIHRGNCTKNKLYLTNRFQVVVCLFSNRSQMTSQCGKNKKVAHEA